MWTGHKSWNVLFWTTLIQLQLFFLLDARLFTETFSRTRAIHPGIFLGRALCLSADEHYHITWSLYTNKNRRKFSGTVRDERRSLIGSLWDENFAIGTAHEQINASFHKLNSFLLSRNIFTFMFGWQFQWNVHKSDARYSDQGSHQLRRMRPQDERLSILSCPTTNDTIKAFFWAANKNMYL